MPLASTVAVAPAYLANRSALPDSVTTDVKAKVPVNPPVLMYADWAANALSAAPFIPDTEPVSPAVSCAVVSADICEALIPVMSVDVGATGPLLPPPPPAAAKPTPAATAANVPKLKPEDAATVVATVALPAAAAPVAAAPAPASVATEVAACA